MRGQRGRLPVQALGYVNSTKVILGLPETAGVHFLLRPHHYILKVITQFRNGSPRANTSMEASFTGILERNGISGWINQRGIYIFTTCWEWNDTRRRAEMQFWAVNKNNKTFRLDGHVIKVVAARLWPVAFVNGVYEPMDLDINIG